MTSDSGQIPAAGGALRAPYELEATQRAFLARVYQWMTLGLVATALVAYTVAQSETLVHAVFGTRYVFLGLILAELGLVVWIGRRAATMSSGLATGLFLLYSALNGLTLSFVFLRYTGESLASTFVVAAGTFGATSLWGYVTKRELTGFGDFLFMGLVGLVIAGIVNLFLQSPTLYWVTSCIGVFVFVGLTAYDTQKLKEIGARVDPDGRQVGSLAICGALALYLDFVNLFLFLLRFLGSRRS
jgi:uncharacterized protein